MKRIILAAAAAAVLGGLAAPSAQAAPIFCQRHNVDIYITACAGSGGGGGPEPFYAILRASPSGRVGPIVRNPETGKPIKVCRSACGSVPPEDQVLND